MFVEYRIESIGFIYLFIHQFVYFNTLNQNIVVPAKFLYPLALQVNDTRDKDRVVYIDSIDSLYTNITGYGNRNLRKRKENRHA